MKKKIFYTCESGEKKWLFVDSDILQALVDGKKVEVKE